MLNALRQFPQLRELNLSDNQLRHLPSDLSCLAQLANLNLNGNLLTDVTPSLVTLASSKRRCSR